MKGNVGNGIVTSLCPPNVNNKSETHAHKTIFILKIMEAP